MSLYASFLPVTHQVHKEDNVLHTLAFEVQVTSSYLKLSQVFEGGGGQRVFIGSFFVSYMVMILYICRLSNFT